MALKDKIQQSLWTAIQRQQKNHMGILRLVLSDIRNAEIAEQKPVDDDKVIEVINKQVRRHRESIDAFKQGNRNDLVAQEEAELEILTEFLPEQMSYEEIVATARQTIDSVGAKGPGDRGKVMSKLMPQLKGKADGKAVSDIVTQLLTNI